MAKSKTVFFCQDCGHESAKWLGQCPACKAWNTFVEETVKAAPKGASRGLSSADSATGRYALAGSAATLAEIGGDQVRIVSGHCRGADLMGERYAHENGLELSVFPAEWNIYGRRAGFVRNTQMADFASEEGNEGALIAFWDGQSRGTKMMIGIAQKKGIAVHVFDLEGRKYRG